MVQKLVLRVRKVGLGHNSTLKKVIKSNIMSYINEKERKAMRIAICDDNITILDEISSMLDEYLENSKVKISYSCFKSYRDISDSIDDFDLFLLDYRMDDYSAKSNEPSGMEFAKSLREKYGNSKTVIFITAYPEIVYDAFEVRAYRFIPKPIVKEKLFKAIDDYLASHTDTDMLLVKTNDEVNVININDIYYLEVSRKDTFIYFKDSCIKCRRTITSFEKELEPYGFMRIHRSFIINTRRIVSFDTRTARLDNGEKIFISQKKYQDLCEAYLKNNKK